jgi:hypothetical protein
MNTKNLLFASALVGALAAGPALANSAVPLDDAESNVGSAASKDACGGKESCKGHEKGDDKADDKADDKKEKKDKNACAGKDGCGGK